MLGAGEGFARELQQDASENWLPALLRAYSSPRAKLREAADANLLAERSDDAVISSPIVISSSLTNGCSSRAVLLEPLVQFALDDLLGDRRRLAGWDACCELGALPATISAGTLSRSRYAATSRRCASRRRARAR